MIHRTMMMILTTLMLISGGVDGVGQDTWVKVIGGKSVDKEGQITTTPFQYDEEDNQDFVITGHTLSNDGDFKGMIDRGWDFFVIKLDKNGKILWKKTFGGNDMDLAYSVTTSDDGILITGQTKSNNGDFQGMSMGGGDIFVMKLDRDGEVLWKKTYGGSDGEVCNSITTSRDGSILITGYSFSNDGDFKGMNKGDLDIVIMKLDRDGEVLWKKTYGGSDGEVSNSITTSDDGILITGCSFSNDGDFEGMNKGSGDIFVMKLDINGNVQWKKTFGGSGLEEGTSITTIWDDILITGGTTSNDGDFEGVGKGSVDIYVIKLDKDGKVLWKKTFGGTQRDFGKSILTSSYNDILIYGTFSSNDLDFNGMNKGNSDVCVIKLDDNGKVLWKKTFGGSEMDRSFSMTTTLIDGGESKSVESGIVIHGGTMSNDGDFKRMNKGSEDIFFMKLDPWDGNLKPQGKKSKKK